MVRKIIKTFVVLVLLILIFYAFSPYYLRKAIRYQKADITDYRIFENRKVLADTPSEWFFSSNYNHYELTTDEANNHKELSSVAFVVAWHDSIVFENYWKGYSDSSLSNSFSVTKSIVSLLVGCAIQDGKIRNIDQPVHEFLHFFKFRPLDRKLTIRHLLTMTSGIEWNESYGNPFSLTTRAYYGNDLTGLMKGLHVKDMPGRQFRYQSCNTQLLGMILEKATGKNISTYASEKLWGPLGASHDALWSLDKENGQEKTYCCFNSNARDFARIGQLILKQGKWNDRQLVSREYIEAATTADTLIFPKARDKEAFYGYQLWLTNYKGHTVVYSRGILGQYIIVIPDLEIVIVRLGEKRVKENKLHPPDLYYYIETAFNIIHVH